MDKIMFCPFSNSNCRDDCMFHTVSSAEYPDHVIRTCLIANGLNNISDRNEELLDNIFNLLRSQT